MTKPETRELLRRIGAQILEHAPNDGETQLPIAGMRLFRASTTALVQRGILTPSFRVVAQGERLARAGTDTELRYGPVSFIASSIDMPAREVARNGASAAAAPHRQPRANGR